MLERKTILLTNVPPDYIKINSGLGEAPPQRIVVLPVLFEGDLLAVIELASFEAFSETHMSFLEQLMESIGVVLNMIAANMRTEELLEQSQSLTQELQSQSEELQSRQEQLTRTNAELESQARELEEKASLLAEQNVAVEMKNSEVELARTALEEKAQQLSLSSKYKSEFLANMSHELRTPLNSMLILAKLLSDNQEKNLSDKQVEFAHTIHASGTDLLNLINEILDLSKVESGKMELDVADVPFEIIGDQLRRSFDQIARQKGLDFVITVEPGMPHSIRTDVGRLQQVLKNLLSNAFKFTESGRVELQIRLGDESAEETAVLHNNGKQRSRNRHSRVIAFAVSDTGIGIAPDKQRLIFEAFQQADGTTSRRYGGTGLGLSISREIARLLGGHIRVESELGKGSTFTLYLPELHEEASTPQEGGNDLYREYSNSQMEANGAQQVVTSDAATALNDGHLVRFDTSFDPTTSENSLDDDRDSLAGGDRVLLIIEDDVNFARILRDTGRQKGFKTLVALSGEIGLAMVRHYLPDAVTLDLQLPVLDGWTVLDQMKRDPETRHIPVEVISVADRNQGSVVGAIAYLQKPVSAEALEGAFCHIADFLGRDVRRLLLVEDDEAQRNSIVELIGNRDVVTTAVGTGAAALEALEENGFDCVILDLGLPDMGGFEVLKKMKRQEKFRDLPVVIYTSKDLTRREETQLKKYAATILNKDAKSPDRLLDETALFLHRVVAQLPESKRRIVEEQRRTENKVPSARHGSTPAAADSGGVLDKSALAGRKVLVVDDDVRNVFALTNILETYGLNVSYADNGRACLETLESTPDIDIILMDVMMPEMDGYETMQVIRQNEQFRFLPIIALTAKAMQGDREKCFQAGATDYIPKPVDTDRLLHLMVHWMPANETGD
jgi:CheY-like chemotaxis protein